MRRFIITGTGRCGTQWLSLAMRTLGYRVGHESVFTPESLRVDTWRAKLDRLQCGCSWLAIARLDEIPPDVAVIQLVREPLAVIRSLYGIQFFDEPGEYADVARGVTGIEGGGIEACARFWLEVNRLIRKRAELVIRVEDPHATLRAILSLIDPAREVSDRVIASVVRNVPSNMNARKRGDVSWADVPEPLRNDIETLAREFGYGA